MRAPATWKNRLLATATCLASITTIAQAQLQCGSPNAGETYKAGQPMSLAIAASPTGGPFVSEVDSLTATLFCTMGNTIATVDIPKANITAPYTYTVPSVGNVTTPTGTDGACIGNKFYISYSGKYSTGTIIKLPHDFTAKCNDITITPEPFYVPPTIPTANTTTPISTPPSTSTSTRKSSNPTTTTSTTTSPSPTNGDKGESESKGTSKTFIVIIVAISAVVILALMAVGIVFHLRRQRKRRMESAIMPWSTQSNNNQFAKMSSSMDEDPRSPGSRHAAAIGGGVAAAGAVGAGYNKPQPKIPQPSHGGYYGDDSYGGGGYGQQQQHGHGHGGGYYDDQDGYGQQQQQDDYYNPYYAQHSGGSGGYQGGAAGAGGAAAAGGYGYRNDKQSYYAGSNQGARTPYQESHDPYSSASPPVSSAGTAGGAGGGGGYYPPPPPVVSGAMSPPTPSSSNLHSAPNELSSTTLTNSSGTGRAPQVILSEMGHAEDGDGNKGGIPMKEMPSK